MASTSKGIFIIGAKRTPFCKYGGALRDMPASHIYATAAKDAIASAGLRPERIDNTVIGNISYLSQCDGGKTPRYCGTYSGVPLCRPALGVNKTCGSGIQSLITAAMDITTGISKVSLSGGTENMSSLPLLAREVRFGTKLGVSYHLEDHINKRLLDTYCDRSMEQIAEKVAKKYNITRKDVDEFSVSSHLKWKAAHETDKFQDEITNVAVTTKNKQLLITRDEIPDGCISLEELNGIPTILDDGEVITARNSASPADGAAAILLASEAEIEAQRLSPLARLSAWACVGVSPEDAGEGALVAIETLLKVSNLGSGDVDLFEINETFAPFALAAIKELKVDRSKVNESGGAISVGHPVAATGTRMAVHMVHVMRQRKLKRCVVASSCGGGQGVAILMETV